MDPTADTRPAKRSRSSVACNRCKERRQKCDNAAPICTNCAKAGSVCAYKGGDHPAWYVESLEDKIASLERALAAGSGVSTLSDGRSPSCVTQDDAGLPPTPAPTAVGPLPGGATFDPTSMTANTAASTTGAGQPFPPSHLGNALGFLSLCASAEPYYVGSSTGFSLANLVQAAVYDRLNSVEDETPSPASAAVSPEAVRNLPSTQDRPFSCHRPRPTTKPAGMPSDELGDALIAAYIDKVHSVYPFLDDGRLSALHRDRVQINEVVSREGRIGSAKLHLVYGIGARHLQLLGTSRVAFDRSLPEAHFTAAAGALNIAFELRSTDSIEVLLLLAIYSLHSPSGPGAWQLTGLAVRLCIELGLHRKVRAASAATRSQDQRRRCLFWSCLILERKVAVTLGRPFSLSDSDIDAEYPLEAAYPHASVNDDLSKLVLHSQLARLQAVTSRIQGLNGRAGEVGLPSSASINTIRGELDTWRAACPPQNDMLQLEYHKAVLLLFQPFLTDPNRDRQTLGECTRAAGAVCQTYKRIHQRRPAGFFLLELHDVLVAGITLIYSLWVDPIQAGSDSFAVLKDLGACSTVLFLIAERWESAKRYRDAFEALVNATTACLSRRQSNPAPTMHQTSVNFVAPLDVGTEGQALFDTSLWGTDDSWKNMLGEITGAVEPGFQDWSWFTDPTFLTMQA